jgi:hypothetical protein
VGSAAAHAAGTEAHGQLLCSAGGHRLRPGAASSAARSPAGADTSADVPRRIRARRTAMTAVITSPRSCGGDMSSPQKCPPTRHYLHTTSDNHRYARLFGRRG